jgi:hypothetical protein
MDFVSALWEGEGSEIMPIAEADTPKICSSRMGLLSGPLGRAVPTRVRGSIRSGWKLLCGPFASSPVSPARRRACGCSEDHQASLTTQNRGLDALHARSLYADRNSLRHEPETPPAPPPTPAREAPGNQSWKSNFLAIAIINLIEL